MSKRVSNKRGKPRLAARRHRTWNRRNEKIRARRDRARAAADELAKQRAEEAARAAMRREQRERSTVKPQPFIQRVKNFFRRRSS